MLELLYSMLLAMSWISERTKKFVSNKRINFKEYRPQRDAHGHGQYCHGTRGMCSMSSS